MKIKYRHSAAIARDILGKISVTQTDLGIILGYKSGQFINNILAGRAYFPPHTWKTLSDLSGYDLKKMIAAYLRDKEAYLVEILK